MPRLLVEYLIRFARDQLADETSKDEQPVGAAMTRQVSLPWEVRQRHYEPKHATKRGRFLMTLLKIYKLCDGGGFLSGYPHFFKKKKESKGQTRKQLEIRHQRLRERCKTGRLSRGTNATIGNELLSRSI